MMTHGDGSDGPLPQIWSDRDLRLLDEDGTLGRNWHAQWDYALLHPAYLEMCKRIVSTGGPVLEVAAGPGGGNLSPLKHLDPNIAVLVNDIEPRILTRWSQYLSEEHPEITSVSFGAFDACAMPLPDAAVACVSSAGGISNILGSHEDVLRECARVLRPGGIIASLEMVFSQQCLESLPGKFISSMVYHPWLFRDWPRLFSSAGLKIVSDTPVGARLLDPGQSSLAMDGASFGAKIEVEWRCIVAKKK